LKWRALSIRSKNPERRNGCKLCGHSWESFRKIPELSNFWMRTILTNIFGTKIKWKENFMREIFGTPGEVVLFSRTENAVSGIHHWKMSRSSNRNFCSNGKRPKITDSLIFPCPRSVWVQLIPRGVRSGAILVSVPGRSPLWMRKQRLVLECYIFKLF